MPHSMQRAKEMAGLGVVLRGAEEEICEREKSCPHDFKKDGGRVVVWPGQRIWCSRGVFVPHQLPTSFSEQTQRRTWVEEATMGAHVQPKKDLLPLPQHGTTTPSALIQLDNIITSPFHRAEALNGPNAPRPSSATLFPLTTKTVETWSPEKLRTCRYGVWTEFLSSFGVDFGVEHSTKSEQAYHFEEMETREFLPTTEFLQRCLAESPAAVEFLRRSRLRRHLYMITAVKIARGASAKSASAKSAMSVERGVEGKVGVDGALLGGAPVSLGPEVGVSWGRTEGGSFEGSSDFVFAFRLRRIAVQRRGEVMIHAEYVSGAMYSDQGPGGTRSGKIPFVANGDACEEVSAMKFGEDSGAAVIEVDEEVVCVRARAA